MSWELITIGVIFLVCVITGIYRGAVRIAVSLATTILTLVIVFFATPYVSELIMEKTPLDEMIKDQVVTTMANLVVSQGEEAVDQVLSEEGVRKVLKAAGVTEEQLKKHGITVEDIVNKEVSSEDLSKYGISKRLLDGLSNQKDSVEEAVEQADVPKDLQVKAIEMAELPDIFKELLAENNNAEIYKEMGAKTFGQYVGSFLARLIINILAFLGTFFLVTIVLRAIIFALNIVADIPVFGFVNRLAGGVIGMVVALTIVWILFIIVTLLYTTSFGKEIYHTIQGDRVLSLLYEYNPIMRLATRF